MATDSRTSQPVRSASASRSGSRTVGRGGRRRATSLQQLLPLAAFLVASLLLSRTALAQSGDLQIFGYFQNQFQYVYLQSSERYSNSFSLQQLNLFLMRQLHPRWTAFINFELVNSFSSSRRWGAHNLEEAWVRYRFPNGLNLKLGLQVPIFNKLNEIKNRTPLLPYIIRPHAYETSFGEFIALDEFVPRQAFAQAYGFQQLGNLRIDYAAYIGNSSNITRIEDQGQSGLDSTESVLLGGRLGLQFQNVTAGFSATHDRTDGLFGFEEEFAEYVGIQGDIFKQRSRVRLGADFSYAGEKLSIDGEFIAVNFDEGEPEFTFDKRFGFVTAAYQISEVLSAYASYWVSQEELLGDNPEDDARLLERGDFEVIVRTIGVACQLTSSVMLKGQYAFAEIGSDVSFISRENQNYFAAAISVIF